MMTSSCPVITCLIISLTITLSAAARISTPAIAKTQAPGPVQDLRVSSRKSREMTVVWTSPDTHYGVLRRYMVNIDATDCSCCVSYSFQLRCNGPGQHSNKKQCEDITERPRNSSTRNVQCVATMTFRASGLLPGRKYTVSVAGYTQCWGFPRNITGTTPEEAPSQAPTITQLTSTNTSVLVRWSPPACRGQNGRISQYNLIVYNLDDGHVAKQLITNVTRLRIEHLKHFSNYTVSVAAVNKAGEGPFKNGSVVRTAVGVPHPVAVLGVVDVEITSITVEWKTPVMYTGPTWYNITVQDLYYNLSKSFIIYGFSHTKYAVPELKPFWNYTVSMVTVTSAGVSGAKSIHVQTDESVPGPVQHLRLHPETDVTRPRTVKVTWQPPSKEDRHGIIKHYHVRYSDTRNVFPKYEYHEIVDHRTQSLTIEDVKPGTIQVQLTAETGPGEGVPYTTNVVLQSGAPLKRNESVALLMTPSTASVSDGQTQIAVQLPIDEFLCNNSNGEPVYWGLIVAGSNRAQDKPFFGTREEFEKKSYKTWFDVHDNDMDDPYITTERSWNPCDHVIGGIGRQRRSVTDKDPTMYIVGADGTCKDKEPKNACNGELKPGKEYRVRSFACTANGCTETVYSEPIVTVSDIPAVVGGVVGAVIVLVVVLVVIYMRRSRKGCFHQTAAISFSSEPRAHNDSQIHTLQTSGSGMCATNSPRVNKRQDKEWWVLPNQSPSSFRSALDTEYIYMDSFNSSA